MDGSGLDWWWSTFETTEVGVLLVHWTLLLNSSLTVRGIPFPAFIANLEPRTTT